MSQNEQNSIQPTLSDDQFIISADKNLSLVKSGITNEQKIWLLQRTPKDHVYTRPAKGGGTWNYVTGIYVQKVLNFVFNWNWDFEVVQEWEQPRMADKPTSVICKGKLTVKTVKNKVEHTITKTQYGRADVKYKKGSEEPLDIGNDYKAAATDALKKCASMLGIASDVYGGDEFKDVQMKVEVDEDAIKKQIQKAKAKASKTKAKAVK